MPVWQGRDRTRIKGSDLSLLATESSLQAGDPLVVEWVSGKGACVRLTD